MTIISIPHSQLSAARWCWQQRGMSDAAWEWRERKTAERHTKETVSPVTREQEADSLWNSRGLQTLAHN